MLSTSEGHQLLMNGTGAKGTRRGYDADLRYWNGRSLTVKPDIMRSLWAAVSDFCEETTTCWPGQLEAVSIFRSEMGKEFSSDSLTSDFALACARKAVYGLRADPRMQPRLRQAAERVMRYMREGKQYHGSQTLAVLQSCILDFQVAKNLQDMPTPCDDFSVQQLLRDLVPRYVSSCQRGQAVLKTCRC